MALGKTARLELVGVMYVASSVESGADGGGVGDGGGRVPAVCRNLSFSHRVRDANRVNRVWRTRLRPSPRGKAAG